MKHILEIAGKLRLTKSDLILYGSYKAKARLNILERFPKKGKLILVSAITPTLSGEGKTTIAIGLGQAISLLNKSVCLALREPSLGPYLGKKGGATGGGLSQVLPKNDINLHFTGDFHAVTSAHNLLSAMIDNKIFHDLLSDIDPRRIMWRRVMDMNDRSLRNIVIGLGGVIQGIPRESGFDITAASEVMAILCLSENYRDLKHRLERILVGFTYNENPITAKSINASKAMYALLKDALLPNLVQTTEGVPAFIHGGPFANIAHGCNSILATKMAMALSDWAVTEAGFGFDLGAEKFFNIKCKVAGIDTAAVVLVATCKSLKSHGGIDKISLNKLNTEAVQKGLPNLDQHIENIKQFCKPPIVCLNKFKNDHNEEIDIVKKYCEETLKVPFVVSNVFEEGGKGGLELAKKVILCAEKKNLPFCPIYDWNEDVKTKIWKIASKLYGANKVKYTKYAERDLDTISKLGYQNLPICIAKTPTSLSDNPNLIGRPNNFNVTIREVLIAAGAGFLIPITGDVLRMPGLPKVPNAESIDIN